MTNLFTVPCSTTASRVRLWAFISFCAIASACSQLPTSPSGSLPTGPSAPAANPASTRIAGGAVANPEASSQTWQDFAARGWNCRTPNNGPVTVCSPPNQPLPAIAIPPAQPPGDRPATVTLMRWRNGVYEANVLLMRPEIYNGQPCESTGLPYSFIGVLGYFECAHTLGS